MEEREPSVQSITASEMPARWSELLRTVRRGQTRVLVEKEGSPIAALISVRDLERLMRFEAQRREQFKILDEIGEAFKDVPEDELEREVARAIAEVRAEAHERRHAGNAS